LSELRWTADLSNLQDVATSYKQLDNQVNAIVQRRDGIAPPRTDALEDLSAAHQVSAAFLKGADEIIALSKGYWPRQSLYHGTLYSVAVGGGGLDPKPTSDAVEVGLGATSTDALSSLMAESVDETEEASREQLLNALQYGLIADLETPDGPAKLAEEVQRRAFESRPGGFTTERIRDGDPFAHLRTPVSKTPPLAGYLDDAIVATDRLLADEVAFDFVQGDPFVTHELHERVQPVAEAAPEIDTVGNVAGGGTGPGGSFLDPPPFFGGNLGRSAIEQQTAKSRDPVRDFTDKFTKASDPLVANRDDKGVEYRTVRRALPRLFYPQDPVAALRGVGRTLRYNSNELLDDEGRLLCRISDSATTQAAGVTTGKELLDRSLFAGSIPREAQELLCEALVNTPDAVDHVVSVARARGARISAVDDSALTKRLAAEDRMFVNYLVPGSSAHELINGSIKDGTFASPKAVTLWHQAWEPTYLEWELDVRSDTELSRWVLGNVDIDPTAGLAPADPITVMGRSLLSRASSTTVAELISNFIDEEERLDRGEKTTGVLSGGALSDLQELDEAAPLADVLHASFDGLRDFFLGFSTNVRYTEPDGDGEILPDRIPELLRAGLATAKRLRVVDAFGRFLELEAPFSVADEIEVPTDIGDDSPDTFLLPPRIMAPSRLWFRFLDATDDSKDAVVDQETNELLRNPVAGWLLPDHVDGALEMFDHTGEPLGQLRNERLGAGVVWEGSPGRPGPMGRPPFLDIANPHAAEFARAMIERDAGERQVPPGQSESTLDALLRAVDTTLWTVDPFADSGLDYYSKMTGRPIALVRARLLLDVVSDFELFAEGDSRRVERKQAYDELSRRKFEVRLGALTKIDDGLLGYFINDDYWRFHPVHASVREQALPSGPHSGYLQAERKVSEFDADKPVEPITHPYVVPDPKIDVQPGHPVLLTLLLDPGTRVHATSGVLPRKAIGLPRAFVQDALARIAPSFRFGPVLVDPGVIRMPKPSVLPEDQDWTRRDTPTSWKDDPIEAATQFAYLPDISHEAQEGYIRVRLDP
jgi:hypothetical protein